MCQQKADKLRAEMEWKKITHTHFVGVSLMYFNALFFRFDKDDHQSSYSYT